MGLFKKDKEKKPPKDDGSDKSWGQIIHDMPKMPTTRDMAQGTANAASFMKNMANAGDTSRLRSTGLKGTAVIHQFRDTGGRVGVNPMSGERIFIQAHKGLSFRPARKLKDEITVVPRHGPRKERE